MSTRSVTHIHESHTGDEKIVCSFFRHCDGYPDGHGKDLTEWLAGKKLVNGIDADFIIGRDFNRAGTMAVSLMQHIQEVSGCEVIPTGNTGLGEEYIYDIYFRNGVFDVQVKEPDDISDEIKLAVENLVNNAKNNRISYDEFRRFYHLIAGLIENDNRMAP